MDIDAHYGTAHPKKCSNINLDKKKLRHTRVFAFCILKLFSVENSVEKSVNSVVNSVTKNPEKRVRRWAGEDGRW